METIAETFDQWIDFTSQWHGLETDDEGGHDEDFLRQCAESDLADIRNCSYFVLFTEDFATVRGGRHVEFGYALAKNKQIHIIGSKENIFHNLKGIQFHDSPQACFDWITGVTV